MWPPGRAGATVSMSDAAVIGPLRSPTRPASSDGSQCSAKAQAAGVDQARRRSTSCAPPGMTSSAGWKISRTRPGSPSRRAISRSARPAPTTIAVCTSWPQAWQTPGSASGRPRPSGPRAAARRGRRAAGRSAASRAGRRAPMSHHEPRARQAARGAEPGVRCSTLRDDRRRALLGPAELGVGVQLAAKGDELGSRARPVSSRTRSGAAFVGHDGASGRPARISASRLSTTA